MADTTNTMMRVATLWIPSLRVRSKAMPEVSHPAIAPHCDMLENPEILFWELYPANIIITKKENKNMGKNKGT